MEMNHNYMSGYKHNLKMERLCEDLLEIRTF